MEPRSSLQHVVTVVLVRNTSAYGRAKRRRQKPQSAAHRSITIRHLLCLHFTPGARVGLAVRKLFREGGAFSYLFPIKNKNQKNKIAVDLVWEKPHSSYFLKRGDFYPSVWSQPRGRERGIIHFSATAVKAGCPNSFLVFPAVPSARYFNHVYPWGTAQGPVGRAGCGHRHVGWLPPARGPGRCRRFLGNRWHATRGAGPGGAAGRGRPRPRPRAGFQAAAAVAPGPGFKSPRQTGKRGAALGSPAAYFSRFPCISTLSNPRKNKQ